MDRDENITEKNRKNYTRITSEKAKIIEVMYDSGSNVKDIASRLELSVHSIQLYITNHVSEEVGRPFHNRTTPPKRDKAHARRQQILDIIERDNSLNQDKIIDQLSPELKCSKRTLQKDLKDLNITRKRLRHIPIERNDPATMQMRKSYATEISFIDNGSLFFLDETGFNLHTNGNYGYQFRGITQKVAPKRFGATWKSRKKFVVISLHWARRSHLLRDYRGCLQ